MLKKRMDDLYKFRQGDTVRTLLDHKQGKVDGYATDGSVKIILEDGTMIYVLEGMIEKEVSNED